MKKYLRVSKVSYTKIKAGFSLLILLAASMSIYAQVTIDYVYDDLNRLTDVDRGDDPTVDYVYDAVGNLTSKVIANSPDTDGDMLANFADEDDDNDQMPDSWELVFSLNPLDASDANSDIDGDGETALVEFLNGTDPTDPQSNSLPSYFSGIYAAVLFLIIE